MIQQGWCAETLAKSFWLISSSTRRSFRSASETTNPLEPPSETKPLVTNSPTSTLRARIVLSMGAQIVASLRRVTRLPLETHMMISDPDRFLDEFVEAGSDSFLVHWEGNANLHRTVQRIKTLGKRAGVVINPAPPAAVLEELLPDVDQVLVMTVDPGFGHQHFLHSTLAKISRVRQMIDRVKPECDLEVDGGIDSETARFCVEAGANVLVAGSSVFGNTESVPEAMSRLRAGGK